MAARDPNRRADLEHRLAAARRRRLAVWEAPDVWSVAHREVEAIERRLADLDPPEGPAWILLEMDGSLAWGRGGPPPSERAKLGWEA